MSAGYPGRSRPGFIEGLRTATRRTASLDIRGVRAPASLKADGGSAHAVWPQGYPGRSRPGFIEGRSQPTPADRAEYDIRGVRAPASLKETGNVEGGGEAYGISGAFAPRLH